MTIFFTADTHFGHDAIIRHCNRPFKSASAMDEGLISRWNSRVSPGDTVYHLGDFCYRAAHDAPSYLSRLNGTVHLIAGNHDGPMLSEHAGCFASVETIQELTIGKQTLVLFHFPMREWNNCYRGAWHLFGHVHGLLDAAPLGHSMDVGVDGNDFFPWSYEEIAAVFARRDRHFSDATQAAARAARAAL